MGNVVMCFLQIISKLLINSLLNFFWQTAKKEKAVENSLKHMKHEEIICFAGCRYPAFWINYVISQTIICLGTNGLYIS